LNLGSATVSAVDGRLTVDESTWLIALEIELRIRVGFVVPIELARVVAEVTVELGLTVDEST